jgi:hypothetical protein
LNSSDQVNQWVTYASKVIPHPVAETLTAWWIGINDTGDTLTNASARVSIFVNSLEFK